MANIPDDREARKKGFEYDEDGPGGRPLHRGSGSSDADPAADDTLAANESARDSVAKEGDQGYSSDQLREAEESPGSSPAKSAETDSGGSFYKPEDDKAGSKGKAGRPKSFKKALGFLKKNKFKLIAGGGTLLLPGLTLLLLQLGSLLFPNLAIHMETNRMKRVTRHFTDNMGVILAHKIALDRTNDEEYRRALALYKDDGTSMFSKINRWRPNKVAEQLVLDMEFHYGKEYKIPGTPITRQKLTSVTIQGQNIPIPESSTTLRGKIAHPVKYVTELREYRRAIKGLLTSDSKVRNLAIRGKAARKVRQILGGVDLWRWKQTDIDKATKDPPDTEKAALDERIRSGSEVTHSIEEGRRSAASAPDGDVQDEANKILDDNLHCFEHPTQCSAELLSQKDGILELTKAHLSEAFKVSGIRKVANGVSVAAEGLQMAALICLFTGNGVRSSEALIAANSAMAVRTGASISAAASQQRYTQQTGQQRIAAILVAGYAAQVGDIYDSNPERIANGRPVDTSLSPSPQAAANGSFETNPDSLIPAESINDFNKFCGFATNAWTIGIATTAEILISIIPGVGQGVKAAGTVTGKVVFKAVSHEIFNLIRGTFTKRGLSEFGATMAVEELAAYFARGLALKYAGAAFNGLSSGSMYVNQADAGQAIQGQMVDAIANASVPLSADEYAATSSQDTEFVAQGIKNQGTYQRYFALTNPDSLANHLAMATYGSLRLKSISSLANNAVGALNPMNLAARLPFINTQRVRAADNSVLTQDYGIVQVGWTPDEEAAFMGNDEYSMFYNDKVLTDSGQKQAIQDKFGKCISGDFAPLLANGDIVRDADANVIGGGLCDRANMGDSGPPNDGKLKFASPEAAMAFRWRVWTRHNNAMDEQAGIENPQAEADTFASAGGGIVTTIGGFNYSFPVDPQIKQPYGDARCNQADKTCHHDNTAAFDLLYGPTGTMDNHVVRAVADGTITKVSQYHAKDSNGNLLYPWDERCRAVHLRAKDGFDYWYGHIWNVSVNPGDTVTAGQPIAQVAPNSFGVGCRGGAAHLHIDRGCIIDGVKQTGGRESCRDLGMTDLVNQIWDALPTASGAR